VCLPRPTFTTGGRPTSTAARAVTMTRCPRGAPRALRPPAAASTPAADGRLNQPARRTEEPPQSDHRTEASHLA
jgi:hypothetical protein